MPMTPADSIVYTQVLCACSGTTVGQLQALIDQGIIDSEQLSRITGACSGCGGCEYELQQLIAQAAASS